ACMAHSRCLTCRDRTSSQLMVILPLLVLIITTRQLRGRRPRESGFRWPGPPARVAPTKTRAGSPCHDWTSIRERATFPPGNAAPHTPPAPAATPPPAAPTEPALLPPSAACAPAT